MEGGDDDDDMAGMLDQFGEGGEGMDPSQMIQVTEEEKASIERLESMGFDRHMVRSPLLSLHPSTLMRFCTQVIQAFIACDKNEELAAN